MLLLADYSLATDGPVNWHSRLNFDCSLRRRFVVAALQIAPTRVNSLSARYHGRHGQPQFQYWRTRPEYRDWAYSRCRTLRDGLSSRSSSSCCAYALLRAINRYWVSMILPLVFIRKHSVPPRSPESWSTDLQESWSLASDEGRASAVFGAMFAHTACITGSKIGTATQPRRQLRCHRAFGACRRHCRSRARPRPSPHC